MTAAEEAKLYQADHAAWCRYAAPRWRDMLRSTATAEEKKALWDKASEPLRAELRALRDTESRTMRRAA